MISVADLYQRFAEVEAHGMSPTYEEWALGVAGDPELCAEIAQLPEHKRQVNLVFAAARHHGVPLDPWPSAREWMLSHWSELVPTILSRATQTNEAGRTATLVPLLAEVAGPIALLEVGASAGLCLFPDRYEYRYTLDGGERSIGPSEGESPVILSCDLRGIEPPATLPRIVWRAGIDLNPLDVGNADDRAWLEALVWPEHDDRRARLTAASALAASDPARIVAGDLLVHLDALADEAPADATLVVFHSAVLVYLSPADRARFREQVAGITGRRRMVWIANEAPGVLPDVDETLPSGLDTRGSFVLSVDGRARALVDPHGRWFRAL